VLWAVYANASVRVPARIWMAVLVCLAVLAGAGAAVLLRRYARRSTLVLTVLAFLIVAEGWFSDVGMRAPDPITPGLIPTDALVLELPVDDVATHTRAQYRAVAGGSRTVNGYSGYQPAGYEALIAEIVEKGDGVLDRYRRRSDFYVIVPSNLDDGTRDWIATQRGTERLAAVPEWQLYRLRKLK
jgi:hypothetical protein